MTLYHISQEQRMLLEAIDQLDGELTPEVEQMLAITEDRMVEKATDYVESIKEAQGVALMCDIRIKEAQAIKAKMKRREESLKRGLSYAMESFGLERLPLGVHGLSFRTSKAVEIDDEAKIPNRYIKVSTTIDKRTLLADLRAGEHIEGARLLEHRNLQIK